MRLAAQFAPDTALLAAVAALARLCLTQGHRTRGRAARGHQQPHNRPVGTDRHEHDATEGDQAA